MKITADEWASAEALGLLIGLILLGAWIVGGAIAKWLSRSP